MYLIYVPVFPKIGIVYSNSINHSDKVINYIIRFSFILLLALYHNDIGYSQDSSLLNYVPPLDIPLSISSNFGDIRDNTFHFGVDFRTNEKEGYPVFAVADGYVARLKIEPGGYGIAVYINHSNGITSVYAHLNKICNNLSQFAKNEQYKKQSFQIDIELPVDSFKVKQCDTIGFSGNKGLSTGPHLHFELRKTPTQNPINCLTNGFSLPDTIPPEINKVWVYPLNDFFPIDNCPKKSYDVIGSKGNFILQNNQIILIPNFSGLGIEAYDFVSDTMRKHAYYSQKLFVDTIIWFETVFDEISFDEVGYVNACIDYAQKMTDYSNIYRLFIWPNEDLKFNKTIVNKGLINFKDTLIHNLKIILTDNNGNNSILNFYAKNANDSTCNKLSASSMSGTFLKWNEENLFQNKFIKIFFPKNSLYSDINFSVKPVKIAKSNFRAISKCFQIGDIDIPLKKPYLISFPINNIIKSLQPKLLIASVNKKGRLFSIGGNINGNFITAPAKFFGTYALFADTFPPKIKPINISNNKNMTSEDSIKIQISDELSGILDYQGTIDNIWVLFEYDLKNNMLSYTFDPKRFTINQNYHLLELLVSDKRGNKNKLFLNFKK